MPICIKRKLQHTSIDYSGMAIWGFFFQRGDTLHRWEWNLVQKLTSPIGAWVEVWAQKTEPPNFYLILVCNRPHIMYDCYRIFRLLGSLLVDLYNAEKRWLVWGVLDSTVICGDSLKDCGVIGRSGLVTPNFQCPLLAKLYVWFKTEVHRLSASLPITGINYLTIGIGR